MVQFKEDNFVITFKTGCDPAETWLSVHNQLITMVQGQPREIVEDFGWVLELICQMMPDWETAQRMYKPLKSEQS